jgi:hypothetical protein
MEAGRSMTSPAAMREATCGGNTRIGNLLRFYHGGGSVRYLDGAL